MEAKKKYGVDISILKEFKRFQLSLRKGRPLKMSVQNQCVYVTVNNVSENQNTTEQFDATLKIGAEKMKLKRLIERLETRVYYIPIPEIVNIWYPQNDYTICIELQPTIASKVIYSLVFQNNRDFTNICDVLPRYNLQGDWLSSSSSPEIESDDGRGATHHDD